MSGTIANTSVDQVFDVLAVVGAGSGPVGVAEVARELDLPTSTAHRVLVTLFDTEYLTRDRTGTKYQLGIMAQELTEAFLGRWPVLDAASPYLRRLVAMSGETVTLSVRLGWYSVRIAGVEGWREIHAAAGVGAARPLDDGAVGRTLLASLDPDDVGRFLRWRRETHMGRPPARKQFIAELASVRRRGYTIADRGDGETSAVVFGVHDAQRRARAAIAIEGGAASFRARPRDAAFRRWHGVVRELEAEVSERPELMDDPYAHLAPDEVRLPVRIVEREGTAVSTANLAAG